MELIDLIPNSMSFRVITTIDVSDEGEIPVGFTGRVKHHEHGSVVVRRAGTRPASCTTPASTTPPIDAFGPTAG